MANVDVTTETVETVEQGGEMAELETIIDQLSLAMMVMGIPATETTYQALATIAAQMEKVCGFGPYTPDLSDPTKFVIRENRLVEGLD